MIDHAIRCPATGKIRYETRADAYDAILNWRGKPSYRLHPYICEHCDRWHVGGKKKPKELSQ